MIKVLKLGDKNDFKMIKNIDMNMILMLKSKIFDNKMDLLLINRLEIKLKNQIFHLLVNIVYKIIIKSEYLHLINLD